jgi:hypothetical protein
MTERVIPANESRIIPKDDAMNRGLTLSVPVPSPVTFVLLSLIVGSSQQFCRRGVRES